MGWGRQTEERIEPPSESAGHLQRELTSTETGRRSTSKVGQAVTAEDAIDSTDGRGDFDDFHRAGNGGSALGSALVA